VLSLGVASRGNVRSGILRAFSFDEMRRWSEPLCERSGRCLRCHANGAHFLEGCSAANRYDLLIPSRVRPKTTKKPMNPLRILKSLPGGSMTIMPLKPIPSEIKPSATHRAHSVKPSQAAHDCLPVVGGVP